MSERDSICAPVEKLPLVAGVEFRSVPGFPDYAAGSDGSVWSYRKGSRWKRMVGFPRKIDGRRRFKLRTANGEPMKMNGAAIVLLAFVGPRPPRGEACHNDGDCTNDSLKNLRWDSSLENKADMKRHGTRLCGQRHPMAKLSDSDVANIKALKKLGWSLSKIANRYSVTKQRIWQITKEELANA